MNLELILVCLAGIATIAASVYSQHKSNERDNDFKIKQDQIKQLQEKNIEITIQKNAIIDSLKTELIQYSREIISLNKQIYELSHQSNRDIERLLTHIPQRILFSFESVTENYDPFKDRHRSTEERQSNALRECLYVSRHVTNGVLISRLSNSKLEVELTLQKGELLVHFLGRFPEDYNNIPRPTRRDPLRYYDNNNFYLDSYYLYTENKTKNVFGIKEISLSKIKSNTHSLKEFIGGQVTIQFKFNHYSGIGYMKHIGINMNEYVRLNDLKLTFLDELNKLKIGSFEVIKPNTFVAKIEE